MTPFVRKCARVFVFLEYDFMILLDCKSCVQLAERVAVSARLCARARVNVRMCSAALRLLVSCVYMCSEDEYICMYVFAERTP